MMEDMKLYYRTKEKKAESAGGVWDTFMDAKMGKEPS